MLSYYLITFMDVIQCSVPFWLLSLSWLTFAAARTVT